MIRGAKETTNFQVLKRKPTKIDSIDNHQDSGENTHSWTNENHIPRIADSKLKVPDDNCETLSHELDLYSAMSRYDILYNWSIEMSVAACSRTFRWCATCALPCWLPPSWLTRWPGHEPTAGSRRIVPMSCRCRNRDVRCSVAKGSKIERSAVFPHLDFLQLHSKFIYIYRVYNMYIICI